jgi:multicomponent K+:H+ antiporter subunit G
MTRAADLSAWSALGVAFLLLLGAGLTLIGSLGLLRLDSFYKRAHAPTLGTTLGTASVSLASALYFSVTYTGPLMHELLILVFVTLTTPVTLMLLVRAALFRDHAEGRITDLARRSGPHVAREHPPGAEAPGS